MTWCGFSNAIARAEWITVRLFSISAILIGFLQLAPNFDLSKATSIGTSNIGTSAPHLSNWWDITITWTLDHRAAVGGSTLLLGGCVLLFKFLKWCGTSVMAKHGERCPAVNSILAKLRNEISDDCYVVLLKANRTTLTVFAANPSVPSAVRKFPIDHRNRDKNKGISAFCWYRNCSRQRHDTKAKVVAPLLPHLCTFSKSKVATQIKQYAKLTHDDVDRVTKLMPAATKQFAIPILLGFATRHGTLVPWGVLLVWSDETVSPSSMDSQAEDLRLSPLVHVLEDVIERHVRRSSVGCITMNM